VIPALIVGRDITECGLPERATPTPGAATVGRPITRRSRCDGPRGPQPKLIGTGDSR
jgi:hypothetical protein